MKAKQTNIRTLWTISTLLNGEEKNQTQIVKELKKIGKEKYPEKNEEGSQLIKTTKAIESPIIKDLTNKGIISGELKDLPKGNLKANFCRISSSRETLIKILDEIDKSIVDESQKKFFSSKLISSPLGQKYISNDLLPFLLKKNEIIDVQFDNYEKDKITFILKNSPQALNYTIKSINKQQKEWELKEAKDYYLSKINTLLLLDLLDTYLITYENKSQQKINFKIEISYYSKVDAIKEIYTEITSEKMFINFQQDIKGTYRTLDQVY